MPRELVEAPAAESARGASALRRANTDPLIAAHRIADALGGRSPAALDPLAALPPPATNRSAEDLETVRPGSSRARVRVHGSRHRSLICCGASQRSSVTMPPEQRPTTVVQPVANNQT